MTLTFNPVMRSNNISKIESTFWDKSILPQTFCKIKLSRPAKKT